MVSDIEPDDTEGVRVRQGDRRQLNLRVLGYTLLALLVIGLGLYAYFYPFN